MKYFIVFTKYLFPGKIIRIDKIMIFEEKYKIKRIKMVEEQIIGRGIKSSQVINVIKKIPRHLFVTEKYLNSAYNDNPLPIGFDQTISQPYIVAFMTEAIELRREDRVLEIGTGSGYQSAVLCELAGSVFSMETIPQLAERSNELLSEIGYKNIKIKIGDGYKGWPEKAPFNKIIITAGAPEIPTKLLMQLSVNGIMVLPLNKKNKQEMLRITKTDENNFESKSFGEFSFVPMLPGKE